LRRSAEAEHRHLVEDELGPEIGRDEIARAVRHQGLEIAVGGERVAQIVDDFRADAATTQFHWPLTSPLSRR